jgi:hypothetical protein
MGPIHNNTAAEEHPFSFSPRTGFLVVLCGGITSPSKKKWHLTQSRAETRALQCLPLALDYRYLDINDTVVLCTVVC